jgi:hypothetical protein
MAYEPPSHNVQSVYLRAAELAAGIPSVRPGKDPGGIKRQAGVGFGSHRGRCVTPEKVSREV